VPRLPPQCNVLRLHSLARPLTKAHVIFVTCVNFAPTQYQHLDVIARSAMDTLCTDSLHTPCTSTQLMACPNVNIVASNTLRGVALETTSNVDARP
jgi:hypothetical protein